MARKYLTPIAPPSLASDPEGGTVGAIYFNTSLNLLKLYTGSTWITLASTASAATANSVQIVNEYASSPVNGTIAFNTTTNSFAIAYNNIWNEIAYRSEAQSPIDGGGASTMSFDLILDGGHSTEGTFINTYYNV